jgi:hypothetical protein
MPRIYPSRLALSSAVLAALSAPGAIHASTIYADGTTCSLANAINSANSDSAIGGCAAGAGKDLIYVSASPLFTADTPPITTDMDIVGNVNMGGPATLDNALEGRGFIIGGESMAGTVAPSVRLSNLVIKQSRARGANGTDGGGGAGAFGGAMLIYAGAVSIDNVTFLDNAVTGGNGSAAPSPTFGAGRGGGGGGGISPFGTGGAAPEFNNGSAGGGGFGGGGGGGGVKYPSEGGGTNGGNGGFDTGGSAGTNGGSGATSGGFGGGGGGAAGASIFNSPAPAGADGGFGGGGGGGGGSSGASGDSGGNGGLGGFGGGGGGGAGGVSAAGAGGFGGFAGGGGAGGVLTGGGTGSGGAGGFGGGDGALGSSGSGAGFGGAVFIRSGTLDLINASFTNNSATSGSGGTGASTAKGGAIFALASLTPSNGNAQGYPDSLPTVVGCNVVFSGSTAASAAVTDTDNVDTYGVSRAGLIDNLCDSIFANGFDG